MGMSVNTNVGAMAALQALNETSKGLSVVQSRINSGLNVASTTAHAQKATMPAAATSGQSAPTPAAV